MVEFIRYNCFLSIRQTLLLFLSLSVIFEFSMCYGRFLCLRGNVRSFRISHEKKNTTKTDLHFELDGFLQNNLLMRSMIWFSILPSFYSFFFSFRAVKEKLGIRLSFSSNLNGGSRYNCSHLSKIGYRHFAETVEMHSLIVASASKSTLPNEV